MSDREKKDAWARAERRFHEQECSWLGRAARDRLDDLRRAVEKPSGDVAADGEWAECLATLAAWCAQEAAHHALVLRDPAHEGRVACPPRPTR